MEPRQPSLRGARDRSGREGEGARHRPRAPADLPRAQADPDRPRQVDSYREDVVEGRVAKVVTFGAFVEILPGVEGLVHISELAPHHVENPREVVSQGQAVNVRILEIDGERRRLSPRSSASRRGSSRSRAPTAPSPCTRRPTSSSPRRRSRSTAATEVAETEVEVGTTPRRTPPRRTPPRRTPSRRTPPRRTPRGGRPNGRGPADEASSEPAEAEADDEVLAAGPSRICPRRSRRTPPSPPSRPTRPSRPRAR